MTNVLPFEDAHKIRPLADRLRPSGLDGLYGHESLMGKESFLHSMLSGRALASVILWGPPGCGKTTIARMIAMQQRAHFEPFSAVLGGVKEVRVILQAAKERLSFSGRETILFVDEIHRFNKSQQDAFLPHVEDGAITLMGATTENPAFALNAALLSRCRVLRLAALPQEALEQILWRAVRDTTDGLGKLDVDVDEGAVKALALAADGDARRALNSLEESAFLSVEQDVPLTADFVAKVLERPLLRHDRNGDQHYDVLSAFIKSMRGSDPDAALYYMARLLEVGEDPRLLLRRMIIFASEDIGNADPRALSVATSGLAGFQAVGMPEGRIVLGQVCTYLSLAPKSNASYLAIDRALDCVRRNGSAAVPAPLRSAATVLRKELGDGVGYVYPHDHGGWVKAEYLPETLVGSRFYEPTNAGYERHLRERLDGYLSERQQNGENETD